jgi:hypothetical protein
VSDRTTGWARTKLPAAPSLRTIAPPNELAHARSLGGGARKHRQHRLTTEFLKRELATTESLLRERNGEIAELDEQVDQMPAVQ